MHTRVPSPGCRRAPLFVLSAALALSASPARAHFILEQPAATYQQATGVGQYGDPQKVPNCGPAAGSGTATNQVTTYTQGSKINISIRETIFHPGHYRVAVASTEAGLPAAPPVTAAAGDECAMTQIAASPTLPLLADGIFAHSNAFTGSQSVQVQLPPGFTCDRCSLQVIQYMRAHGAPCFYYHCATISVVPASPDGGTGAPDLATVADGSAPPRDAAASVDGGAGPGTPPGGGCSCSVASGPESAATSLFGAALVGLLLRRRPSRRPR